MPKNEICAVFAKFRPVDTFFDRSSAVVIDIGSSLDWMLPTPSLIDSANKNFRPCQGILELPVGPVLRPGDDADDASASRERGG